MLKNPDEGISKANCRKKGEAIFGKKVPKWAVALGAAGVAGCGALVWMAKESSYSPLKPSDEELIKDLPGGDLIDQDEIKMHAGREVTINVAPAKVYPYLVQLGCHKVGFYSYGKLERLCGFHIYNDLTVEQKWQDTKVGDWIPYRQNGAGTGVVGMEDDKYLLRIVKVIKGCAEGTNKKAERQKARNAMRARKYNVGDPTWGNQ